MSIQARAEALRQRTQEQKAEDDALWADTYKLRKREALERQEASLEAALIALDEQITTEARKSPG
jgi:hypothetical protein